MSGIVCPKCGDGEHVVMLEDGVWMCTDCVIEFNEDGRVLGGKVNIGEFYIGVQNEQVETIFYADVNVSLSAPLKNRDTPTINVTISLESVGDLAGLITKLHESLKRVKR